MEALRDGIREAAWVKDMIKSTEPTSPWGLTETEPPTKDHAQSGPTGAGNGVNGVRGWYWEERRERTLMRCKNE